MGIVFSENKNYPTLHWVSIVKYPSAYQQPSVSAADCVLHINIILFSTIGRLNQYSNRLAVPSVWQPGLVPTPDTVFQSPRLYAVFYGYLSMQPLMDRDMLPARSNSPRGGYPSTRGWGAKPIPNVFTLSSSSHWNKNLVLTMLGETPIRSPHTALHLAHPTVASRIG